MKKVKVFILLFPIVACAQNEIGHSTKVFVDMARDNRAILSEIFYPSYINGVDVPPMNGTFPTIVFGHDRQMDYTDYENITVEMVHHSFVLAFVETENNGNPNYDEYIQDLSFVMSAMIDEGGTNSSLFYGHLDQHYAMVGHGIGGGCAWIAATQNSNCDIVVGLAPSLLDSTVIAAAALLNIPALVISGTADEITSPVENHQPIFDNTLSSCKFFASLIDGSHCGFANEGSSCDLEELNFSGMPRLYQQLLSNNLMNDWLAYCFDYSTFNLLTLITNFGNQDLLFQGTICSSTASVQSQISSPIIITPNPVQDIFHIEGIPSGYPFDISIFDALGHKEVYECNQNKLDISTLDAGLHFVEIGMRNEKIILKIIKM